MYVHFDGPCFYRPRRLWQLLAVSRQPVMLGASTFLVYQIDLHSNATQRVKARRSQL